MKQAKISAFSKTSKCLYDCQYEWTKDCFTQCGDSGIVFSKEGNPYKTAFFEAFPQSPKTFIRGEGNTIEDAEKDAWQQYAKHIKCDNHEFQRRGYRNGAGFCKHCGLFKSNAFEPIK